jgi:hypothetical protein
MASITGIVSPNPVQENTNGSPITLNNVVKDDFFVIIAAAGGTEMRPNIALSGVPVETLADTTATPKYHEVTTECYERWWGWPWSQPYYVYYGWPYCGSFYWHGMHPCTPSVQTYCTQRVEEHRAQMRVQLVRARADGVLTAAASLAGGNISRFTVYHFRCQAQSTPGKVIDKVSWVLRTPQAVGREQNTWSHRVAANDLMLIVAAGNSGPTIAANPSDAMATNLVNYIFTHGPYVQTLVRLDWVNSNGTISYQFIKANVSQFIAGYSVDLRERYADFPSTGSVYWVVAPVRVNSSLQYIYPKPLEQAIVTAAAIDPVSFGIEFTFPRGNIQYSEDRFGQINVSSYEELHIIRLPSSVQIPSSVGDILLTDSELEAYITGLMRGWIA